jgi:ABC-type multidrug transport system fused ATPase/permease subunit
MASVQQSKKEKNEEKGEEAMTRLKKKKPDDPNKELNLRQNPLDNNKNPFNVLLFFFIQPLIVLGTKKALEMSDMIRLPFSDLTAQAWKRLETQIERERKLITDEERKKVAETKKTSGWRIIRALYRAHGIQSLWGGICLMVWVGVYGFQPLFIRAILNKIVNKHDPIFGNFSPTALWITLLCFALVQIFFLNHAFYWMFRFSFRMRAAVMNFVYRKAIKLSSASKLSQSSGNIVTLMSVDPMLIFGGTVPQHWIWLGPVLIIIAMSLLSTELGPVSIVPVAMMCIMASIQVKLFNLISVTRRALLKKTDKRISVITEILSGIRIIKSYAWEKRAAQQVQELRGQETDQLRRLLYLQAANQVIFFISPPLIGIGAFLTYQYIYQDITVDKVVVVLAYTNLLRLPMAIMPRAIGQFIESLVSYRRLEKFYFFNEEVHEREVFHVLDDKDDRAISLKDSEFSWDSIMNEAGKKASDGQTDGQPFKLFVNDLTLKKGQLCIVCGTVGSGKTSLLSAILGEMTINKNKCFVNGAVSYVSQRPWIQNSTVRDGILFAREYEKEEYDLVVEASQLSTDLEILPYGDETEIGERGINLSGGQKQRVAIARALYNSKDKDIYLLDDPLSAVDVHVANKLWESAIGNNGILKDKTRILVLNSHYHLLKEADLVCIMDHGKLAFCGNAEDALEKYSSLLVGENSDETENTNEEASDQNVVDNNTKKKDNEGEGKMDEIVKDDIKVTVVNTATSDEEKKASSSSSEEAKDSKVDNDDQKEEKKLYKKEDRAKGVVGCGTYLAWFRSASSFGYGIPWALFIVTLYLTAQVGRTGSDFLLTYWAKTPNEPALILYISLTCVTFVLLIARGFLFMYTSVCASVNFHDTIFTAVLKAPINLFFDVTKTGQIINRFSSDMDHVDVQLPTFGIQFFQNSMYVFAAVVVCAISNVYFVPFLIPIGIIYYTSQYYYRKSSREVKRLEGISRSPIFSGFQEMLNGVETIRAFDQSDKFVGINDKYVDRNNGIYLDFQMCSRWLALRLDVVGISIFCTVAALALFFPVSEEARPVVGLGLVYCLQITGLLQWTVRTFIETENNMTAVERLEHYTKNIPLEKPSIVESNRPAKTWPANGAVEFKNVVMSYRPGLPQVLKKININIKGGEKVGVCGRTGSGKSSMIVSLLRLVELDGGSIIIDGMDISKIGLSDLRSNLSLIPQEPVLFSGDVRHNLDPFDDYIDNAIWEAIRNVGLDEFVKSLGDGLQSTVAEQGLNFSAGQRQLICVARALLRGNKIIIMDEATASVDSETDQNLQKMIRTAFADCTVICIAHRIDTILDSDKICVLDDGLVLEFDTPENLLQDKDSSFYALVDEMKKNKKK